MDENCGLSGKGTVKAPPRFIFRQSEANLYVRSAAAQRIDLLLHNVLSSLKRMHPVCIHTHMTSQFRVDLDNALNPTLDVASYAENNKPIAIRTNARALLGSAETPFSLQCFFCRFFKQC